MASGGDQQQPEPEEPVWRDRLGQTEAKEFDNSLFFEYEFSIDQLMELAGLCVAQVSVNNYDKK
jgi:NAD(P)H-hydrate repair Nnr-like enzyme with NAD(P)H-hydrate epimerase domain